MVQTRHKDWRGKIHNVVNSFEIQQSETVVNDFLRAEQGELGGSHCSRAVSSACT